VTGARAVLAPAGWLGVERNAGPIAVVVEAGLVTYAGPRWKAPPFDEAMPFDGFLMPAVADRHVHIGLSDPAAVLRGGVAAVRDLAWPADEIFPLAEASEVPSFNGPLVRAAGPMLTGPGGYPTSDRWAPPLTGRELHGPEDAANAVRLLAGRGAAAIKVSLNAEAGPTPTDAELATIVESAHARSIPVTAHAQGRGQVERAIGAGVDELAHCPWTERLPESVIEALARATRVVSTLDIWSFGEITQELRVACDNLTRVRNAGGTVVYGTDLGNGDIPAGIDVREAFLLHEACRMPVQDVLAAMTAGPIGPGAPADLIVLARDPFDDLAALGELRMVMRAGRVVDRR
jgi:imidazolonepropionase-like amidohydrolase